MLNITQLKVGDKVHHQPSCYGDKVWDNGIVREIDTKDSVWVVYSCDENWDRYTDYVSEKTNLQDLKKGWRF